MEYVDVGGVIILKWILKIWCEGVDWIQVAEESLNGGMFRTVYKEAGLDA